MVFFLADLVGSDSSRWVRLLVLAVSVYLLVFSGSDTTGPLDDDDDDDRNSGGGDDDDGDDDDDDVIFAVGFAVGAAAVDAAVSSNDRPLVVRCGEAGGDGAMSRGVATSSSSLSIVWRYTTSKTVSRSNVFVPPSRVTGHDIKHRVVTARKEHEHLLYHL